MFVNATTLDNSNNCEVGLGKKVRLRKFQRALIN